METYNVAEDFMIKQNQHLMAGFYWNWGWRQTFMEAFNAAEDSMITKNQHLMAGLGL